MKEFEIRERPWKPENVAAAPVSGWARQWHGFYLPPAHDFYTYGILERFSFLGVVACYPGEHVTLFELGAGRADWCMALAGCVERGLISDPPASYRALAIEAEPTHFRWMQEVVAFQELNVHLVYGAVCEEVGERRFRIDPDPLTSFGQCIVGTQYPGESIAVPSFTVDYLRKTYEFPRVNIVHMDVQGAEADCVRGARRSLEEGAIDHFIIETHSNRVEGELRELLSPGFECLVDLPHSGTLDIPGFSKTCIGKGGGLQTWRRKDL